MKYFAAFYDYDPTDPRLDTVRPLHRAYIAQLNADGHILGSGPHTDELGGALIILQLPDATAELSHATELIDADPFIQQGIVSTRTIRPWNPVINSFE